MKGETTGRKVTGHQSTWEGGDRIDLKEGSFLEFESVSLQMYLQILNRNLITEISLSRKLPLIVEFKFVISCFLFSKKP